MTRLAHPRRMRPKPGSTLAWAIAIVSIAAATGCGGPGTGVPVTVVGRTCAFCGMEVRNPRFAAVTVAAGRARSFDSIECAIDELNASAAKEAARPRRVLYLADYASGGLHRSDSLWVVRATIPSPMGGGLAAFSDRREAERIAVARGGSVTTAAALLTASRVTP